LSLAALFWAGNFVAGRALRGDAAPVTLNVLRWLLCLALFLPFVGGSLVHHWPVVRREWRLLVGLGATGIAAFHTLVYLALVETTAVNALLILTLAPVLIMAGAALMGQERPSRVQWLGSLVSLAGALVLVTRGDVQALAALELNKGDLWMLGAVVAWAIYSLLLRRRPRDLPQDVTLAVSIIAALGLLLPLLVLQGSAQFHATPATLGALVYIAVFASLIAFLLWSYGVDQIGAAQAGQFVNLMPVFGAGLAVLLLGERIISSQVVGAVFVFAGILLVQRRGTAKRR
jgi:drug/metabolite transporter (DMT)-like permease